MKFAHLADCHLGGWREQKLKEANEKYFCRAIDMVMQENVDFCLIAGDLFNTSFPPLDSLKICVEKLRQLKDAGIPVYTIAGSHDFSPSGKTMLNVLESAGLATNTARGDVVNGKLRLKFVQDKKTGIKITGLIGKRGGLDKKYYEELDREMLENEIGEKIFMFHCTIQEIKPKELEDAESMPISFLPKGFNYYAGGHIHIPAKQDINEYKNIIYPGPIFPNNFAELEKLKAGSLCIIDDWNIRQVKIEIYTVKSFEISCGNKTTAEIEMELAKICEEEIKNNIITIRLYGKIKSGKITEIRFNELIEKLNKKGAYIVLRNTNKLESKEFEEVKIKTDKIEDVEALLIKENSGKSRIFPQEEEQRLAGNIINILGIEKEDGQKTDDFEKRIILDADSLFNS